MLAASAIEEESDALETHRAPWEGGGFLVSGWMRDTKETHPSVEEQPAARGTEL